MSNPNYRRTYRDLCYDLKSGLDRQGFPSSSSRFSEKQIYDSLLDSRTTFLKRTKIARRGIGQENVQTISCVKLEEADTNICPCNPPTGCKWLKSVKPIPKSIMLFGVTNTNASFQADFAEWTKFKNKLYARSNKEYTRYFTILETGEGPYLYLYNDDFLDSVSITGLWENPNHAAVYNTCGEETETQTFLRCNPLDTPVYMDGDIVDAVKQITIDSMSRRTGASTVDIKQDSLDSSGGVQNPIV